MSKKLKRVETLIKKNNQNFEDLFKKIDSIEKNYKVIYYQDNKHITTVEKVELMFKFAKINSRLNQAGELPLDKILAKSKVI